MKKRNLLMLGLIALMAVVVFVSCMQDPILDNKAIGKWIAQNNMGDRSHLMSNLIRPLSWCWNRMAEKKPRTLLCYLS